MRARRFDLLGCALALLYAAPSLLYPFGSDQGIHFYLGAALLRGELPYVSGISGKPPGIFAVHALAIALFGSSQAAIRLLEWCALPLLGYLLARCARPPGERRDGDVGAATLLGSAATFTYQDYWNTAHPEAFMGLCLVAALAVALRDTRAARRALLAGALCALAFSLKYTAAAVALPISMVAGLRAMLEVPPRARPLALAREALLFLAGVALVAAVFVLPYALTGTLRQLREVCWDMTVEYAKAAPHKPFWPVLWKPHGNGTLTGATCAAFAAGVLAALARRDKAALARAALIVTLIAAATYSVVMQGRLFSYHFIAIYPFFVLALLWGGLQLGGARGASMLALALTLGAFSYAPKLIAHAPRTYRAHVGNVARWLGGELSREQLWAGFERLDPADRYADILAVSRLIRAHARPSDTLCLARFVSPIYELTGLRCTSRHAIGSLVSWGPPSWSTEYRNDLRARPPTFMVFLEGDGRELRSARARGYFELGRSGVLVVVRRA